VHSFAFRALRFVVIIRSGLVAHKQSEKIDAVRHIMATLYSAQNALRSLAPEYKWAGLGNLLGDYGEFLSVEYFGLQKAPAGSDGFDAILPDGRTVQVKTNHAARQIGFRGKADVMLVIHVTGSGEFEVIYYGPFQPVLDNSRRSERENKNMISLSKLRQLQEAYGDEIKGSG
jgi:hypothetical protein